MQKPLFQLILAAFLLGFALPGVHAQQLPKATYVCPPCGTDCHAETYDKPGICPTCRMTLVDQDALAGPKAAKRYPVAQLREDFRWFRAALEENHPALYWHTPKDTMDKAFGAAEAAITGPMDEMEFFRVLMPVVTRIGCGHTFMPVPAEAEVAAAGRGKFFPLKLVFVRGKAYAVPGNGAAPAVPRGSEIVSINGKPMDQITDRLFRFIAIDNNTRTYKYKFLEERFADFYHHFVEAPDSFALGYRHGNALHRVTLPALTRAALAAAGPPETSQTEGGGGVPGPVKRTDKVLFLDILPGSPAAVLTIRNFSNPVMAAKGQQFKPFIDSAFRAMEKAQVRNLVIDLRGNSGGSTGNGSYLYAYLAREPFVVDAYLEAKTLPLRYVSFAGVSDSRGNPVTLEAADFTRTPEGSYRLKNYPSLEVVQPHRKTFSGKVFVLVDGWVASEGTNFSYLVRQHKRGVFIGQETGGNYNGCSAGLLGNVFLPNTGLRVNVPVFKIVHPVVDPAQASRGLLPEHPVEPTIEDVMAGKDAALAYALRLMGK